MDAPYYNGDEDRDYPSVEDRCDQCGCELYPSESKEGRCVRCQENAIAAQREVEG